MRLNLLRRTLAGTAVMLALTGPVVAHPHILIDAKVNLRFDAAGAIVGLQHAWTFDSAFSAWMVLGLDSNGDGLTTSDELQPLADWNLVGLADYDFFSYAGGADSQIRFAPDGDQRMDYVDGRLTLRYSVSAATPFAATTRFELAVYDPEYYAAVTYAGADDVTLEAAPTHCSLAREAPKPLDPAISQQLNALGPEIRVLPPELAAALRGTQELIVVSCGDIEAGNIAQSTPVPAAAARSGSPFGGLPPEPGLSLSQDGFFGWLQLQQRNFYAGLQASLNAMRTDWTAFWVLGGLSFLYGVFHAAGPGHGKVVISSYVLANETQLRRGVVLSGLAALLQSLVAIGFVLIAAGVIGMTSVAMGEAVNWIGIVSNSLVALLGLWLVARKLFGWGHDHRHVADHQHSHTCDHHHDQHHDHSHSDHEHLHAIPPEATTGSWRERLGVVLAVGLRPCSGALVVMVFALSQGLLPAGILAVLLMGTGTAITVATLATIAVTAKGMAQRIGGIDSPLASAVLWWAELAGAAGVLLFGLLLLIASF